MMYTKLFSDWSFSEFVVVIANIYLIKYFYNIWLLYGIAEASEYDRAALSGGSVNWDSVYSSVVRTFEKKNSFAICANFSEFKTQETARG